MLSDPQKGEKFIRVFDGAALYSQYVEDGETIVTEEKNRHRIRSNSYLFPSALDVINLVIENQSASLSYNRQTLFIGDVSSVNGRMCQVLEIRDDEGGPERILYLDEATGLIIKQEIRYVEKDSTVSDEFSEVLDNIKLNVDIDESVFDYTPPDGA